ncbi:MAG: DUF4260 domain-containing protein [Anaerolineales bacterium]|nr:DUF4260 domain-containing protein [Anaerolineales bacterium]MCB9111248.1 DUF4260 domain-containing protein [Anaerolineales bacterium]
MKNLIRFEEFLMLAFALLLFSGLDYSWWLFALLFFAPDLSMLGYLINPRLGAWTYNLIHHKGLAVTLYAFGYLLTVPWLMFAGTLLFAHSSFDRIFGYGLKHEDSFQHTHLGMIGR